MFDPNNPNAAYWVVVAKPGEGLKLHQCTNPKGVVQVLKDLPAGVEGVVISGTRLFVTKGPFRFLKVPGQEPVPLFDLPTMGDIDVTNGLGFGTDAQADDEYTALMAAENPVQPPDEEQPLEEPGLDGS